MTTSPVQQSQTMTLRDGRILAWYEYGDHDGVPCVYTTGTPASGLMGELYDEAARAAGVRWISVDKPGYGASSFQPGRTLRGYAADIRALLDHLGLGRVAAAGESGGGPHVLALAHEIPQRLTAALVLAGMGPNTEKWARAEMKPMNRRIFAIAANAPWLLNVILKPMASGLTDPKKVDRFMAKRMAESSPADRAQLKKFPRLLEISARGAAAAFPGRSTKGAAQELALMGKPWGFALEDITVPVHLWHGTTDVNVPVAIARRVITSLPNCQARIIEGEGHAVALTALDDIFATVKALAP